MQSFNKNKTYNSFLNEKKQVLSKQDKSTKGSIDRKVVNIINIINKHKFLFTTSSCSGRILLMKETGKKQEKAILQSWHKKINFGKLAKVLKKLEKYNIKEIVYLKLEPFILHIASFSYDLASKIVNLARQTGFKKSGFYYGKRRWAIIELRGTEEISLPIFKNRVLVTDDYIEIVIDEMNKKLAQNFDKIKRFEINLNKLLS